MYASHGATGGTSTDPGMVFIFVRSGDTWLEQARLELTATSLDFDDDTLLVGQSGVQVEGDDGAALVLVRSGSEWLEQGLLHAADGDDGDEGFGISVAIDGDTAIVGATRDEDNLGAAYVFVRQDGQWAQQARLAPDDLDNYDDFGWAVAVDGDTALVSRPLDTSPPYDWGDGSVYVFSRVAEEWTQAAKLFSSDPDTELLFGDSVAVSGNTILVGEPGTFILEMPGQAHLFANVDGVGTCQRIGSAGPLLWRPLRRNCSAEW